MVIKIAGLDFIYTLNLISAALPDSWKLVLKGSATLREQELIS